MKLRQIHEAGRPLNTPKVTDDGDIVPNSIPGTPGGRSVGVVAPNIGKSGSGIVLKRATYPTLEHVLYIWVSANDVLISIQENKVQPDPKHAGTKYTNPPPYGIGNRAIFSFDDILLGHPSEMHQTSDVIERMEEVILYDWGYGGSEIN
jgi:hypothetical protein